MQNSEGRKPLFLTVTDNRQVETPCGCFNSELPEVDCRFLERQFERLGEYQDSYLADLVEFLRSQQFTRETGHKAVVLSGFTRTVPKTLQRELKLQVFYHPSNSKKVLPGVYSAHLTHPETKIGFNSANSAHNILS